MRKKYLTSIQSTSYPFDHCKSVRALDTNLLGAPPTSVHYATDNPTPMENVFEIPQITSTMQCKFKRNDTMGHILTRFATERFLWMSLKNVPICVVIKCFFLVGGQTFAWFVSPDGAPLLVKLSNQNCCSKQHPSPR